MNYHYFKSSCLVVIPDGSVLGRWLVQRMSIWKRNPRIISVLVKKVVWNPDECNEKVKHGLLTVNASALSRPLQECPSRTSCGTRTPCPSARWSTPGTGCWWEAACRSTASCPTTPACSSALPEMLQEKSRPTRTWLLPVSAPATPHLNLFLLHNYRC